MPRRCPTPASCAWASTEGKQTLGLRLTWDKRYITLGPVATLLGLAFRAFDPEHLLGDKEDLGITCALIPTHHPGVNIGRRHMPLSAVFQNGPNWGKDVFVPMEWVIGGQPMIGKGWRMLMECLAAGRSISLPSLNTGMAKMVTRATGGYARVRSQFKTPIGKFEGIEEPLARMGGYLYSMDAARVMTAGAVDLGEKPAVLSAIVKYHLTERGRQVANDAMDIAGGKGICMGPRNFLGAAYMQTPVSITVEGANILTRSLIIFGQGAIRCHPFVLKEFAAANNADLVQASIAFDDALFGHLRFVLSNIARTLVMGLCGSHCAAVPANVAPETRRYYQQLTRFSAALAFLSDVSMGVLGGALKRKEKLSARLGDVLSMLYVCSATLKRYEVDGRQAADAPLMNWAIWDALFKAQNALEGVISNFPNRVISVVLRRAGFPARATLCRAIRLSGPRSRAASDRALRDARPLDLRHLSAKGRVRRDRRDRTRCRGDPPRRTDRGQDSRRRESRAHVDKNRRGPRSGCAGGGRHQRRRFGTLAPREAARRRNRSGRRFCAGPWRVRDAGAGRGTGCCRRRTQGRGLRTGRGRPSGDARAGFARH